MPMEDNDMTEPAAPDRPRLPGVTRLGRPVAPQKVARVPGRPKLAMAFVVIAVLFAIGAVVQAAALWVFVPFALFAAVIFALGGNVRRWDDESEKDLFQDLYRRPEMVYGTLEYDQLRGYRRD